MIYLLRHGETEFNAAGRYQGRVDSPLTPRGRAQAAAGAALLAEALGAAGPAIWTSPLGRARATAEILRAALPAAGPPRIDPRLTELAMGEWEGMTRAGIEERWPGLRRRHPPREWMFHAPGGERMAEAQARLAAVLAAAAMAEGPVVLVGHGVAGRLLRGLHRGLPPAEALRLPATQGEVFALLPGGGEVALSAGRPLP